MRGYMKRFLRLLRNLDRISFVIRGELILIYLEWFIMF